MATVAKLSANAWARAHEGVLVRNTMAIPIAHAVSERVTDAGLAVIRIVRSARFPLGSMAFSICSAAVTSGALNTTSAALTHKKVRSQPNQRGIFNLRLFQIWLTASATPCIPPKIV